MPDILPPQTPRDRPPGWRRGAYDRRHDPRIAGTDTVRINAGGCAVVVLSGAAAGVAVLRGVHAAGHVHGWW